MLELFGGCGQESVVDGQQLSWAAVSLLPGEVRLPELRGTILQSTDAQRSLVEAIERRKKDRKKGKAYLQGSDRKQPAMLSIIIILQKEMLLQQVIG